MVFSPKDDFDHTFYFLQKMIRELYKNDKNKGVAMTIYKRILTHNNKCKDEDCMCIEIVDRYFNTIKTDNGDKTVGILYYQLVIEIDFIMKKITERIRLDSTNYTKQLLLNVPFSTFFKNQYIISFIIIQKIENSWAFKRNTLLRLQVSLLRHTIIFNFHNLKKYIIKKIII